MAIIANTFKTYETVGRREQLEDVIYNIDPKDTPFMSNAGRDTVDGTFNEWQGDSLAAADTTNKQLEGDDLTSFTAVVPTVRYGNYQQISRKDLIIARTQERVKKAGRKSERSYQLAKKGVELKRDMEAICLTNQAANAGAAGTARATGSLLAFVKTNVDKEGTGVNPTYTSGAPLGTRTDGATRAFTETILKNVVQLGYTNGANFSTVMLGAGNKQVASGFSGVATKTLNQTGAKAFTIVGAADIYVSDFGVLTFVPNRFQRNRDAHFLDFDYIQIDYLDSFKTEKLAKTGDAEKAMIIVEWGLRVKAEKALGLAADLA